MNLRSIRQPTFVLQPATMVSVSYLTLVVGWCLTCEPLDSLVASATPYPTQHNGHCQPPYHGSYLSAAGRWAQHYHPGLSNWDGSPVSTNVHQPRAVPHDYWGVSQGQPPASTFYAVGGAQLSSRNPVDLSTQEDVHSFYQPNTGPGGGGLMPVGQFQPYGTSGAYLNELGNPEAGPSTQAPLHAPPMPRPSGGRSETTADAEIDQTFTEEHRATVSNFYCFHIPRVTE